MSGNLAVAYREPGRVEIQEIDYPTLELKDGPGVNPANVGRQLPHGVILKTLSTNICGSDQHMVRGRTTAPAGLILGHEITGEVIETGPGVEFIKAGDVCSVPFNISCGRCRNCKAGGGICLNVKSGSTRFCLRIRRYGRLGRGSGRVRRGALRRLELAPFPRP